MASSWLGMSKSERDAIRAENDGFDERAADMLNPESPNYVGPGYADQGKQDANGRRILTLNDSYANDRWQHEKMSPAVPENPNPSTEDLVAGIEAMVAPPPQPQPKAPITTARGGTSGFRPPPLPTAAAGQYAPPSALQTPLTDVAPSQEQVSRLTGVGDGNPATAPGAEAPTVNREAVDKALAPVNQIGGLLMSEAMQNRGASVAEAQLREATAKAEAHALGTARTGNRRDRAFQERQAIGEGAYLEQEGNRQAATLRAQEEQQNRQFKIDTLTKAGELGLNVAAYEIDISKADLASANNWINQEFAQLGLDKQLGMQGLELDQRKLESILGFTRDMAAIQFEYDQLGVADQNEADALMMQKYGVDQQTMVALKQIKEAGRRRWQDVAVGLAGGAVSGVSGAIGAHFLKG